MGLTLADPADEGPPKYGGVLRFASTAPGGFDMHLRPSWAPQFCEPVFNTLVRFNPAYIELTMENLIGDLAKEWEISADGMTYTFYLEQGVKWHDGKPFTADDAVYSVNKMMTAPSRIKDYFPAYQSVEKVDDYTLKIMLQYPSPAFLVQLAGPYSVIQAQHMAEVDNKSTDYLMGTGPFMFKSYKPESSMELVKNPNFFRKDDAGNQLPYLDGIQIFIMKGEAIIDALIAERLDLNSAAMGIQGKELLDKVIQGAPEVEYTVRRNPAPYLSWFNMNFEPFKDVRVRQAIVMLMVPEDQVIARLGAVEFGDPGRGLFNSMWGLPKEEIAEIVGWDQSYEARVAEAQRLMKEAGYADGFKIEMVSREVTTAGGSIASHTVLADKLRRYLNIESEIIGLPTAEATKRRAAGEFEIYGETIFALLGDPDEFSGYFITDAVSNFIGYSNPEVDALWEKQSREMDPAARRLIVQDIERLILADAPILPIGVFAAKYMNWYPQVKNFRATGSTYGVHIRLEGVWLDP